MQLVDVVHEHLIEELLILTILGLVLVKTQLSHSLLCSLCLLCCQFLLSLFFLFLGCLDGLEFIEYVLIVQNSVGKFISKIVFRKQFLDTLRNYRVSQDCVNVGPFFWVDIKHTL